MPSGADEAQAVFRQLAALFAKATGEEKRCLADALLAQATVLPDQRGEFDFYSPQEVGNVVQNRGFGGAERIRTADLLRAREALSLLSYCPTFPTRSIAHRGCLRKLLRLRNGGCLSSGHALGATAGLGPRP